MSSFESNLSDCPLTDVRDASGAGPGTGSDVDSQRSWGPRGRRPVPRVEGRKRCPAHCAQRCLRCLTWRSAKPRRLSLCAPRTRPVRHPGDDGRASRPDPSARAWRGCLPGLVRIRAMGRRARAGMAGTDVGALRSSRAAQERPAVTSC